MGLAAAALFSAYFLIQTYFEYNPTPQETAKSAAVFDALQEPGNRIRLDQIETWDWDTACIVAPYQIAMPFPDKIELPYTEWINSDHQWGLVFYDDVGRVTLIRFYRGEINLPATQRSCVSRAEAPRFETIDVSTGVFQGHPWTTIEVRLAMGR